MGKHLLIASDVFHRRSPKRIELEGLAQSTGASVTVVDTRSSLDVQFCQGFQIGAFLRWHVDPSLLDEPVPTCVDVESCDASDDESDASTTSTTASKSDDLLLQWLEGALKRALNDSSAAEALTMCADVILSDDTTTAEERLENTIAMLRGERVPEGVLSELSVHILEF